MLFSNAKTYYEVTKLMTRIVLKCLYINFNSFNLQNENTKVSTYAKDLELFFDAQLRKLLPKYYKPANLKIASNNQLGAISFQDCLDEDMDDPSDFMLGNNPKRKRSTPGI